MIAGLQYIPNYLTPEEHDSLLQTVQEQLWLGDLKRRVQHYGYKYDYKARRIDLSMKIGELPIWAEHIALRLHQEGIFTEKPDQLIVNEYQVGQGIAPHVDCEPCFTDTIVSISLGSNCVMDFIHLHTQEKKAKLLEVGSAVILQEASRYDWQHGITARKTDKWEGKTYARGVRVSLTFRKVLL